MRAPGSIRPRIRRMVNTTYGIVAVAQTTLPEIMSKEINVGTCLNGAVVTRLPGKLEGAGSMPEP